ncbi:MAG: tetratricopeptide repeat protein [Candidatus Aegiribacteria sp.]
MAALLGLLLLFGSMDLDELAADLHLETGMALLQQGLLERAEQEFMDALEIGDEYHSALLGLGMVNFRRSSWTTAADYFHRYIQVRPDDYRGYRELAVLYLRTGRPDSARIMSDSAFVRSPTLPSIWLLCGKARLELGEMASAADWFSRGMLDGGSTSLESLVLLASVYRRTDRGHEARELLIPAVEQGYAPACWELARVYLEWNDYMRAADAIQRYLMLSPSGHYADSAALVLQELGESGEYME